MAQNLLYNGGFEDGEGHWQLFAPADAAASGCAWETSYEGAHSGTGVGKLTSPDAVRYGIVNYLKDHTFLPGQRYRLTLWIKAGEDFAPDYDSPGFLVRVTMFSTESGWQNAQDGIIYVGADSKMVRDKDTSSFAGQTASTEWTKLEIVFDASPDTAKMNVSLFVWKGSGSFYVDDVSLELVDDTMPVTAEILR